MKVEVKQAKDVKVGEWLNSVTYGYVQVEIITEKDSGFPLFHCSRVTNGKITLSHPSNDYISVAIPDASE